MVGYALNAQTTDCLAQSALEQEVVPGVSQLPGFVAGYWLEPRDGHGWSTVIFDSEEAARRAAENVRVPEAVRLERVDARAVIAHA